MKYFSFKIYKKAIFSEVSLATAYTAAKSEGDTAADFDRVATIKADEMLLDRCWTETCGLVIDTLRNFLWSDHDGSGRETSADEEEHIEISIMASASYDESLNLSVEHDIFAAVAAGVTSRWFKYALPERAAEWEEKSQSLLDRALSKLCYRAKPRRR